jgi:hypothetical protein
MDILVLGGSLHQIHVVFGLDGQARDVIRDWSLISEMSWGKGKVVIDSPSA